MMVKRNKEIYFAVLPEIEVWWRPRVIHIGWLKWSVEFYFI